MNIVLFGCQLLVELSQNKLEIDKKNMVEIPQLLIKNPFRINHKNASQQNRNSFYSFRPVYIISRIFGQMPFSIVYNSNGTIFRPAVNKLDGLWFPLSIIVFVFSMYPSFKYFTSIENFESISTVSFVGNFCIFGCSSLLGFSIVLDMCIRFRFVDVFKKIAIFDQRVSSNVKNVEIIVVFITFVCLNTTDTTHGYSFGLRARISTCLAVLCNSVSCSSFYGTNGRIHITKHLQLKHVIGSYGRVCI